MRKLVAVAAVLVFGFGVAVADEFGAIIQKVDGNKVTFTKLKKGEKGEEMTLPAAATVKVVKGKKGEEKGKFVAGDAIEGGLKNKMFTTIEKGVFARITTSDDNKTITQIMTIGKGKKKEDK
jgi:hypothetical protein